MNDKEKNEIVGILFSVWVSEKILEIRSVEDVLWMCVAYVDGYTAYVKKIIT